MDCQHKLLVKVDEHLTDSRLIYKCNQCLELLEVSMMPFQIKVNETK